MGRTSIAKRGREQAKRDKRKEKDLRRQQRKAQSTPVPKVKDGNDPDLAGMVAGPQRLWA